MSFLEEIKSPAKEYSPAAFWFWYGDLEPEKLRRQIRMMTEQGVYNGFMHARAYLKTEYLGEDWWKAVEACIDEGEKVGFYPWLYDEYAWPSGTAGSTFRHGTQTYSRTLAKGECNISKILEIKTYSSVEEALSDIAKEVKYRKYIASFYKENGQWKYTANLSCEKGEIMVFFRNVDVRFVDYLNKNSVKDFIECTHEEYKKRFGEHFGKRVPGIFFDEIFMASRMPWTDLFAEEFKKRKGYDIIPLLYALTENDEKARKIRNDYYNVVSELYEEGFFAQIGDWCENNSLALTGHIEEFFIAHPGRQGQFFNNERHLTIPGADCHDYRYRFPRKITYREPKFAVSVARAYGKKRMMSEAFGGAGWGCSLQEFKRGVNTLCATGINMITLHGFYSECESQGEQADWPTSFFFQNPYWRYFKHFADYMARVCYMNTQGKPVVEVGLYYPIEEMQKAAVSGSFPKEALDLDIAWNDAMSTLIESQIDVDIIDEPSLLRSTVADGHLDVGDQSFRVLLFPDVAKISKELEDKLCEFTKAGGHIIYYACSDKKEDGVLRAIELPTEISKLIIPDISVVAGSKDNLYTNHRKIEGKDVYFVANGKGEKRSVMVLLREGGSVQKLSVETGDLSKVTNRMVNEGVLVDLDLEADEGCWLVVDKTKSETVFDKGILREELAFPGVWEFLPIGSDVAGEKQLTETTTNLEIPLAVFSCELHPDGKQIRIKNTAKEKGRCSRHMSLWKANWIARRPDWIDNAQKKQLFLRKEFVLEDVPAKAELCIVAVNRWTLYVNGKEVAFCENGRTPSVVDVCAYLTKGENLIAIKVENDTPMDHFNLLPVSEIPENEMISLLLQGEITVGGKTELLCSDSTWDVLEKEQNGWETNDFETNARTARSVDALIVCGECEHWLKAWERGRPPLLPWGDIELFGKTVSYPQRICYTVTLPAGTKEIAYPEVSGSDVEIMIDGIERSFKDEVLKIHPDGLPHTMNISLWANSGNDGLLSNVSVKTTAFESTLCDWRLHGLKWYSGFARYKNKITLAKGEGRYILKMPGVSFHAEVWVNGRFAGERVWQPYELDVTDFIIDGENEVVVIVSNSAGVERQFMLVDEGEALGWNRYWNYENIQREGENLVSGLTGKVSLDRVIFN